MKVQLDKRQSEQAFWIGHDAPNQNVGPAAETRNAPPVGNTAVQVKSRADPGAVETGSSSGSSCPVQPASYLTSNLPSTYRGWWAMHVEPCARAAEALGSARLSIAAR